MVIKPKVGDSVVINADVVRGPQDYGQWIVDRVNRVNVVIKRPDGVAGRPISINPAWLTAWDPNTPAAPAAKVTMMPYRPTMWPGTLVRWDSPKSDGALFVVIADKVDRVNIVRLGGDDGRYWRVAPSSLTIVDPSTVGA